MLYPRLVFVQDYYDSDSLLKVASYGQNFASVVDLLDGTDLNSDSPSSFGRKSCPSDHGAKEMKMLNSRIAELQSKNWKTTVT